MNRRFTSAELVGFATSLAVATPSWRLAQADNVVTWGSNINGQLGQGTYEEDCFAPTMVLAPSESAEAIAAGGLHSLAVRDGCAYAWGRNAEGQLGDGTRMDIPILGRLRPTMVNGLCGGVTLVAAGPYHSLAVQNGAVIAWGSNTSGQLGDGTIIERLNAVAIDGLSTGVEAIECGGAHSLAIQNGALYAWGSNFYGQVGDGTHNNRRVVPTPINAMNSQVTAIAAGNQYSMAVRNGRLYTWGRNEFGQLGDGTFTNRNSPVAIEGLPVGVSAIAASVGHSLAVVNGEVFAWGRNQVGQVGDGTMDGRATPTRISGPIGVVTVAAGSASSYALCADGSLWVWGYNGSGCLGLGNDDSPYLTPQRLVAPDGFLFTAIDAGIFGTHGIATIAPVRPPCDVDLDDGTGSGSRDRAVTIDDLLFFVAAFEEDNLAADLDNGSNTGTRDNAVTIEDLLYFLGHFEEGC